MPFLTAGGRSLEYQWIEGGKPALVFLHEGLGSIRRWREFPQRVAQATGRRALVYDRYGYGGSDILAEPRRSVRYMHEEALESLPEILKILEVTDPVLIGHSDGASIALIYAGSGNPLRGLIVLAPHVFVEAAGLAAIEDARRRFETGDLRQRMGKYHKDPRKTFHLWNDVWLDPEFRRWNIEQFLAGVRCPLLAIQGEQDPYGGMAQLEAIARQVTGHCELVKIADCRHAPHRDQPERTLEAVADFIRRIL